MSQTRAQLVKGFSNTSAATDAITIDSSGNVAIGGDPNAFSNYTTLTIGGSGTSTGSGIDLERSDGNIYGRVFADANGLQIAVAQSGDDIRFETVGGAEKCRILAAGGLTFNGDTAAANALDDYEEGTWTPSLGGGTGAFDSDSWGQYTKIGRRVHLNCFVKIDSMDDTSQTFLVAGVPFTPVDPGSGGFAGSIMCNEFVFRRSGGTDGTMVTPYITDGTGGIRLYGQKNDTGWGAIQNVDLNVDDQMYISISFNV